MPLKEYKLLKLPKIHCNVTLHLEDQFLLCLVGAGVELQTT